jgi:hypothetical protein
MTMTLLAVALLLLGSPALAFNEPDSFRGVPWGAAKSEAVSILAAAGEAPTCDGARACRTRETMIGSVPTTVVYQFDEDDRFEAAILTFHPSRHDALRAIFVEQYGPPSRTQQRTTRSKDGRTFVNEIAQWSGERVVVQLQKYGALENRGRASVAKKAVLERFQRQRDRFVPKGKDDP